MNKVGVAELLALVESGKILGVAAGAIFKDGKFNFTDLPVLLSLVNKGQFFVETVKALPEALVEAKDLDKDELVSLVNAGYAALIEVKNAFKA